MQNLAALRQRAGLTQAELAAKLGVTQPAIAQLERTDRFPDASRLPAIADALGCSIDALFGRSPPPSSLLYPGKEDPVHVPDQAERHPKSADQ